MSDSPWCTALIVHTVVNPNHMLANMPPYLQAHAKRLTQGRCRSARRTPQLPKVSRERWLEDVHHLWIQQAQRRNFNS